MSRTAAACAALFLEGARAALQAWTSASLLALSRPERIDPVRDLVRSRDAVGLAALLVDMAGPIKQARMADVMGPYQVQHARLMQLVVQVALKCEAAQAASDGAGGGALQLERVVSRLAQWIESGRWATELGCDDQAAEAAARMGALVAGRLDANAAARLRLVIVAPLAPCLKFAQLAVASPEALVEVVSKARARGTGPDPASAPASEPERA